jgi:hypothetical protein
MEDTKEIKLESLSYMIGDFNKDQQSFPGQDSHHILYSGNINSNIMLVKLQPDPTELHWAKQENIHNKYVFFGEAGNRIRNRFYGKGMGIDCKYKEMHKSHKSKTAEKNLNEVYQRGFIDNSLGDLFFINYMPFYSKVPYPKSELDKYSWIFKSICEIIKPKIIITFGYDLYKTLIEDVVLPEYEESIYRRDTFVTDDNVLIIPFVDEKGFTTGRDRYMISTTKNIMFLKHLIDTCAKENRWPENWRNYE